jgi:hypothetical protein
VLSLWRKLEFCRSESNSIINSQCYAGLLTLSLERRSGAPSKRSLHQRLETYCLGTELAREVEEVVGEEVELVPGWRHFRAFRACL